MKPLRETSKSETADPHPPSSRPHHIHVSRRSFLAGSTAILAAGAAATILGCDETKDSSSVAGTSATEALARTAVDSRGGTLRLYNFDAAPYDTLDPHLAHFSPIGNTHAAIFSRLLRYEDEVAGTIAPDLAASMPEQPDDRTYVFRIRDGVRFHDTAAGRAIFPATAGRLLTADDIRLSIERQRNGLSPNTSRFYRRGNWNLIDKIDVPDAQTLIIRMRQPVAPMLSWLAGRHAFVLPREVIDKSDEITSAAALIGTGPFVLDSFEDRVAVRLRRNPNWFAADDDSATGGDRPYLNGYDAFFSPQEDAFQRAAFERRIVDVTGFADQSELSRAHKTNLADIVLEQVDAGATFGARLLLDRPPFRDDRVRQALHLALDRKALIEAMYPPVDMEPSARLAGAVAPGAGRWVMEEAALAGRPGYRADPEGRQQDMQEARQLWDAAMGADPPELRVTFAGMPRIIPGRAIDAVRSQLQAAFGTNINPGIDRSGQVLMASAYQRNLDGATEGALTFAFGLEDGGVDLDDWLYPHFRSGEALNTYRLQDAQLDGLLDAQRGEFDEEVRRQIGLDIQEYLLANVHARLAVCAPVERRLVWGYVRNSRMPFGGGSTQDLADVWLDEGHPSFGARAA